MSKSRFTGMIKLRGWKVKDALERWGRSQDWYHRNCNGDADTQARLTDMINGLPSKGE